MINRRIKNAVLTVCTVSLLLSTCGCGKKKKDFTDTKQFTEYLENKMDAKSVDLSDTTGLSFKDWEKGFYVEDSGYLNVNDFSYGALKLANTNMIYNTTPMRIMRQVFTEMDKAEASMESVVYCKFSYDKEDWEEVTIPSRNFKTKTSEEKQNAAFIYQYSFDDEDDALDFFTAFTDMYFDSEGYENEYEEQKDRYEQSHPKFHTPQNLTAADGEIKDREIYELKDLPKSVYELDKKKHTGHFTFHTSTQFPAASDIFLSARTAVAECIAVNQGDVWFSMELKGNTVVLIYNQVYSHLYNTTDVYYDQWISWDVEYDSGLKDFTKAFGISDPEKADINDDLQFELRTTAGMYSNRRLESVVYFPEVYVRKRETTVYAELYGL